MNYQKLRSCFPFTHSPVHLFPLFSSMSTNSILVRNINNLTDVRYFAAMGVDWMSMELNEDPHSFSLWHTLQEWISGVKLAAEIHTRDESVIAKAIIDTAPDGIISDTLDLIHLTVGIELFLVTDKFSPGNDNGLFTRIIQHSSLSPGFDVASFDHPERIYLEGEWIPEAIGTLISKGFRGGFCFRGSVEALPGVKDYSQLDAMIEIIKKPE